MLSLMRFTLLLSVLGLLACAEPSPNANSSETFFDCNSCVPNPSSACNALCRAA